MSYEIYHIPSEDMFVLKGIGDHEGTLCNIRLSELMDASFLGKNALPHWLDNKFHSAHLGRLIREVRNENNIHENPTDN